jgi:hypothetical protein
VAAAPFGSRLFSFLLISFPSSTRPENQSEIRTLMTLNHLVYTTKRILKIFQSHHLNNIIKDEIINIV